MGERTGNTDLSSLVITLSSHPQYSQQVSGLINSGRSLADVIELVQDATGYTMRPVQPGYGFDAMVNRS
jgi:isopropylmalate/homocitrate/citramalate synthase